MNDYGITREQEKLLLDLIQCDSNKTHYKGSIHTVHGDDKIMIPQCFGEDAVILNDLEALCDAGLLMLEKSYPDRSYRINNFAYQVAKSLMLEQQEQTDKDGETAVSGRERPFVKRNFKRSESTPQNDINMPGGIKQSLLGVWWGKIKKWWGSANQRQEEQRQWEERQRRWREYEQRQEEKENQRKPARLADFQTRFEKLQTYPLTADDVDAAIGQAFADPDTNAVERKREGEKVVYDIGSPSWDGEPVRWLAQYTFDSTQQGESHQLTWNGDNWSLQEGITELILVCLENLVYEQHRKEQEVTQAEQEATQAEWEPEWQARQAELEALQVERKRFATGRVGLVAREMGIQPKRLKRWRHIYFNYIPDGLTQVQMAEKEVVSVETIKNDFQDMRAMKLLD